MLRAEIRAVQPANPDKIRKGFQVCVLQMFRFMGEGAEIYVSGFATVELAREYAKRRTRDTLEEQRPGRINAEDLRDHWHRWGEDCMVFGGNYRGAKDVDFFIVQPATPEERDWTALDPNILAVAGGEGGQE
jgi:hypothetical protein